MKRLVIIFLAVLSVSIVFGQSNIQEFKEKLWKTDIKHKEIVLAQAILETGWLKSSAYRNKNNAFGYWRKGLMSFDSIDDCIDYYRRWQLRHYKGGDYYAFLECLWKRRDGTCVRYAQDPQYINKLKSIVKKLD